MSFKLKCLNNTYISFIKSFNDKQKYYLSLIWIRFMRRIKLFGFQLRNKKKWRIVKYCQPLNGYRVDFCTYHRMVPLFRARVDRKKIEKERKAAEKKNKKKQVVVYSKKKMLALKKERFVKLNYIRRDHLLGFKTLDNFLKETENTQPKIIWDDDDEELELTPEQIIEQKYTKLISKLKNINKSAVKKRKYNNTKYTHIVNQFFKSKQRTDEGIEIKKTLTYSNLDPKIKLLIRARLAVYNSYYFKRVRFASKKSIFRLINKKSIKGFDFLKFKNVSIRGMVHNYSNKLKKKLQ